MCRWIHETHFRVRVDDLRFISFFLIICLFWAGIRFLNDRLFDNWLYGKWNNWACLWLLYYHNLLFFLLNDLFLFLDIVWFVLLQTALFFFSNFFLFLIGYFFLIRLFKWLWFLIRTLSWLWTKNSRKVLMWLLYLKNRLHLFSFCFRVMIYYFPIRPWFI